MVLLVLVLMMMMLLLTLLRKRPEGGRHHYTFSFLFTLQCTRCEGLRSKLLYCMLLVYCQHFPPIMCLRLQWCVRLHLKTHPSPVLLKPGWRG